LALAVYFLFKKAKMGAGCQSLDQDSFKNAWEGVAIPLIAVAFAAAFRSLVARCKKRVRLGGKFDKKSYEINILLALIVVILFTHSHLIVFTPRTTPVSFRWTVPLQNSFSYGFEPAPCLQLIFRTLNGH
jgi:hypothetical protein